MPWFYAEAGQQKGPVADEEFERLVHEGVVRSSTMVWREGMADWQPYSAVNASAGATCVVCRQQFPIDAVMQLGEATVCAACKPVYLQRLREGASAPLPVPAFPYAGFWIRALAAFIDLLLLEGVSAGIHLATGSSLREYFSFESSEWTDRHWILLGTELALDTAYETLLVANFGGTVGKLICRIRVVTADGQRLSLARSFGRALALWVSLLPCGLGYVMAAFDSQKRALHDRICGTRVIWAKQ